MSKYDIAIDTIKNSISAIDVANAMGWEVKHGRCKCPIHGGTDYNCRLYPGNRGYMCWVCKSSGDVISLVRNYYRDMRFPELISWFNGTFHMGLELDKPIDPAKARQAEIARQMRKTAQENAEFVEQMRFDLFLTVDQILALLEEQRDLYVPKTAYEPWSAEFCNAVRTIPAARRFAERCLAECTKERRET